MKKAPLSNSDTTNFSCISHSHWEITNVVPAENIRGIFSPLRSIRAILYKDLIILINFQKNDFSAYILPEIL